jgi:hypothetical protein
MLLAGSGMKASAHAFGSRYDLPLPLWLYLASAGAAVGLTFTPLALLPRRHGTRPIASTTLPLPRPFPARSALRRIAGAIGILVFGLILVAGLFGIQSTTRNFAPAMVWVIWWVGLVFFTALAGNMWPAFNPWTAAYDAMAAVLQRCGLVASTSLRRSCPRGIGAWPAVMLFATFAWLETASDGAEHPRTLACLVIAYSVIAWIGMVIFGRRAWLASADPFHRLFAVLGRFAPIRVTARRIVLRVHGAGLIQSRPVPWSATGFIILMLATVSYDGFAETPVWAAFLDWLSQSLVMRPLLIGMQQAGIDLLVAAKTFGLAATAAVFAAVYLAFCAASAGLAGGAVGIGRLAGSLVHSLVPIAIGYHFAHYLSYLLLAGQLMIGLVSDPLGFGWDLFGTADHAIDIGVIDAATVWYVAIAAIVVGHVIAVTVAHFSALNLYRDSRRAILSQIPMLVLMMGYTMTSLWILSQPIVAQ